MRITKSLAAAGCAAALLGAAACSSSNDSTGTTDTTTTTESTGSTAATGLVGPGCAAYAKAVPSGAGSVSGMAQDPVAVAAGNNPLLTTLVKAVSGQLNSKVDLVDTLDSASSRSSRRLTTPSPSCRCRQ